MKNSIICVFIFWIGACSSSHKKIEYGLQGELSTFLPARIIVMPCQATPEILLNITDKKIPLEKLQNMEDTNSLCTRFDAFILKGFENQPFMRGFSPKAVRRILAENKADELMKDPWNKAIDHTNLKPCKSCSSSIEFYMNYIATNKSWLFWLADISLNTKHSDAILFPFVTWGYSEKQNVQGIESFHRIGKIELILIDINSGNIIWARERSSAVITRKLTQASLLPNTHLNTKNLESFAPPDINVLSLRLFQDDLWRDFPGRLNYK